MQKRFIEQVIDYLNSQGFINNQIDLSSHMKEIDERDQPFVRDEVALAKHMVQERFRNHDFVSWSVQDVLDRAEELGVELTKTEARDILSTIIYRHDANIGINWDVIDVHITQR